MHVGFLKVGKLAQMPVGFKRWLRTVSQAEQLKALYGSLHECNNSTINIHLKAVP